MTTLDFLLFAGLAASALYVIYRLFLGWLDTRSDETATEKADKRNRSSNEPLADPGSRTDATLVAARLRTRGNESRSQ